MIRRNLIRVFRHTRPWLPFLAVGLLLYFLVSAVSPVELATAVRSFQLEYLPALLGTYVVYLVLRSLRWHLLLRPFDVPNSAVDSILLFTAAQAAVLVPAGQFLLPVLQKSQHGTLIRRSAATVLVQELLFGFLILPAALPGLPATPFAGPLLLLAFGVSVGAGALLLHERTASAVLGLLERLPFRSHHLAGLAELRENFALVANTKEAILGSVLDLAAMAAGGTGLYIAMLGLGMGGVGWVAAMSAYAFGNAAAVVTSLPGGLGATEDTGALVLTKMGLAAGPAAAAMLIFRASWLVLGTTMGWLVLIVFRARFNVHPSFDGIVAAIRRCMTEAEAVRDPLLKEPDEPVTVA